MQPCFLAGLFYCFAVKVFYGIRGSMLPGFQCTITAGKFKQLLQILSITLLNKTPLNQLFQDALLQYVKEQEHKQLKMF